MTDDEHVMYSGLSDYHDTIVTIRFTVAGLHIAATAFLAEIVLSKETSNPIFFVTMLLGFGFAIFALLLELRNTQLLDNVVKRGIRLEASTPRSGFFTLMEKQYEEGCEKPKNPFTGKSLSFDISHKIVLAFTYLLTIVFWIVACALRLC